MRAHHRHDVVVRIRHPRQQALVDQHQARYRHRQRAQPGHEPDVVLGVRAGHAQRPLVVLQGALRRLGEPGQARHPVRAVQRRPAPDAHAHRALGAACPAPLLDVRSGRDGQVVRPRAAHRPEPPYPRLPGRRPLGHRSVAQDVPAGRQGQAQGGGGGQVRLVEAAENTWCLGRVAHVQQVARAVGRIGEPGQPFGACRLRLDHEHVFRGQPGQREPPAGRRPHRPPIEDRAARRGGQLGKRGRPGLPAPEPDLGPRPDRAGRPRGQVEEHVVGADVEQSGSDPRFGFGQCWHSTIMMPNGCTACPARPSSARRTRANRGARPAELLPLRRQQGSCPCRSRGLFPEVMT